MSKECNCSTVKAKRFEKFTLCLKNMKKMIRKVKKYLWYKVRSKNHCHVSAFYYCDFSNSTSWTHENVFFGFLSCFLVRHLAKIEKVTFLHL